MNRNSSAPLKRNLSPVLKKAARDYPVVTLFGPRQAGKTTLVRDCFPDFTYVNLEDPETRQLAELDYKAFLKKYPEPVIIDEIQRVPSLTSAIQVAVDANRRATGRFILTGSCQTDLFSSISQSLAGRTSVLSLFPLSVSEALASSPDATADEMLTRGFMPELQVTGLNPTEYYRNYFRTYVERDLRQLVNIKDLNAFERFLVLLAGRIGQPVNFSTLSGEAGVSGTTLSGWLSILEASYIVFRLPPWFANISKRTVKRAKVYFAEPGLAAYLLGIETPAQMSRDPLRGRLFENMVVADALKRRLNAGLDPNLFFLRTEKEFEIDLIIREGRKLRPIEIKSAMTYQPDFAKNLLRFAAAEPNAESPAVIYDGDGMDLSNGVLVRNFRNA